MTTGALPRPKGSAWAASSKVAPPLVFAVLFFGGWELAVKAFDIKPYFLVAPSDIAGRFFDNIELIWKATKVTGLNAAYGLLFGAALGVLMSFVLLRYRLIDELVTPLSIAVNAIPIFVLVSVMNNMFSITSEVPRRLMVTLVVYFAVLINVTRGLRDVNATHVELMHSYAASDWQVLRRVRIPNAVPYFFTAVRIAAPISVITAYVSEYFGGAQNGLGNKITSNLTTGKKAEGWAYVAGACVLGLTFFVVASVLDGAAARRSTGNRSAEGA